MAQPVVTISINLDTSDVKQGEGRVEQSFGNIERVAVEAGKRIRQALGADWSSVLDAARRVEEVLRNIGQVSGAGARKNHFIDADAELKAIERVRAERMKDSDARKREEMAYSDWWNRELGKREALYLKQNQAAKDAGRNYVDERRRQEFDYTQWWERELKKRDAAEARAQEQRAAAARQQAKDAVREAERVAANARNAVRGVGAPGTRLQFAGGTDADVVRITRLSTGLKEAEKENSRFNRSMIESVTIANLLSHAIERVGHWLLQGAKYLIGYSARTAELQIAAHAMARANNISTASVDAQAASIQRLNITTQDSYAVMARFIQAQLDLSKANKLAVVAQDLAVVAGVSTQEEIERLSHAILTLQPEVLRTAGVFITIEQEVGKVAQATGRSIQSFSQQEKQMITLNAVLEKGALVAGTYAAALDNPAKQARSLQRVIEELTNAVGAPLLGAVSASLKALTWFLEVVAKAPGVVYFLVAAATALGVAILALNVSTATWVGQMVSSVIPALARLAASMYAVAASFTVSARTIVIGTAGWAALLAVIGLVIYALYAYATAQAEVKRADARQVDALLSKSSALKSAGDELVKYTAAQSGGTVAFEKSEKATKALDTAIRLLPQSVQAAIRSNRDQAAQAGLTARALREQSAATEELMRAQARQAAAGAQTKLNQLGAEEQKVIALLAQQAELRKELAAQEEGRGKARYTTRIVGGEPVLVKQSTSQSITEIKGLLASLDTALGNSGAAVEKTKAEIEEIIKPIADMTVGIERLTGKQFENGEAILKWNGINIEQKEKRQLVLDAMMKQVDLLRIEAQRYDGLTGAVNGYVDALKRLLVQKRTLNFDDTPGAVSQNVEQLDRDVTKQLEAYRQKTVGTEGFSLYEDLKARLGREPVDEDFKRQTANLFRTELKQLDAQAKAAAASLGTSYKQYVEQAFPPTVVELMKLTGALETAADKTKGFTDKAEKAAKTVEERLADKIVKLRKELTALAAGGESGYATYEQLDLIKSKVQNILDLRAELDRDVGRAIPGIDPKNVDKADVVALDAQAAIYERQRKERDEIFRLTQRQRDAESDLAVLLNDALLTRVDAETRAQRMYLENTIARKEAEADLTAAIAIEYQKRHESGVALARDVIRLEADAVLQRLQEQNSVRENALKEIYGLSVEVFGDKAFGANPLVRQAAEMAAKGVTPEVGQLQQANGYLASIDRSLAKLAGTTPADDTAEGQERKAVLKTLSDRDDVSKMLEGLDPSDRRSAVSRLNELTAQLNLFDRRDLRNPTAYDAQGNPTAYGIRQFNQLPKEEQEAVGREAARRRALERESREFNAQLSTDKYNFKPRTDAAYSTRERDLTRATEVTTLEEIEAIERRIKDLRTSGSKEQLNAIQQFNKARLESEAQTLDALTALKAQEQSGYLESLRFRRTVEAEAEAARLRERQDTARKIILLEEEIKHAGHNAANEYREAWLQAYRDVQKRDEDAVKEQIRAQVELADAQNVHSEQVRAGVLKHLASQKTMTEAYIDALTGAYDAAAGLIDRGLEKITRRLGVFGDIIKDLLSSIIRLTLNKVFMRLLDALFPGATSPGGAASGGAGRGQSGGLDVASIIKNLLGGGGRALNNSNGSGAVLGALGGGGTAATGGANNPLTAAASLAANGGFFGGYGSAQNAPSLMPNVNTNGAQGFPLAGGTDPAATPGTLSQQVQQNSLRNLLGDKQKNIYEKIAETSIGKKLFGNAAGVEGAFMGGALGASLGVALGGQSRAGQILGGIGGGVAGGVLGLGISQGLLTGAVTFSALGFATLGVGAALMVGAYILGRNAQRRADERTRDKLAGDSLGQLQQLKAAVENGADGTQALQQAAQIRSDYMQQASQLKDRKTREIAQKDVWRLDLVTDQIRLAAQNQLADRKRDRIVPEFAVGLEGGAIPGAPGSPQLILGHGGEYVINSSQQAAIGALVLALAAKGEQGAQAGSSAISRIADQSAISYGGARSGGGGAGGGAPLFGDITIEANVDAEGITVTGMRSRRGREEFDRNYNNKKKGGHS